MSSASLATHCFAPPGLVCEFPLVAEEDLEEAVAPLRRLVGPGDLEAAGDRVGALAATAGAQPAQALRLQRSALRLRTDVVVGRGCAVRLAEGVAAGDQGHGLLVVHGHPGKGLPDEVGRCPEVRHCREALRD